MPCAHLLAFQAVWTDVLFAPTKEGAHQLACHLPQIFRLVFNTRFLWVIRTDLWCV